MNKQQFYNLLKTSLKKWLADNSTQRAAALTFYIILPLPSLLLIVIAIFAQFYGQTQAVEQLVRQIAAVAGPAVAGLFSELLESAASPFTSVWVSVTVVGFSLVGAIGAFSVLRDTMDVIWMVTLPKRLSLTRRIRQKIVPFALVSSLGLIVIAWTGIITVIFGALKLLPITSVFTAVFLALAQIILSFAVATLLFAVIYKMIPEAKVAWRDVALASAMSGLAFTITNYVFGSYIQTFTVTTIIGAAGSLMIILLWIFIINQIVLFGAEFSKAYAYTFGSHCKKQD
jgi:membrane protein